MEKYLGGFSLGFLIALLLLVFLSKGSKPFMDGMIYCKDKPVICDKLYTQTLMERKVEESRKENKITLE